MADHESPNGPSPTDPDEVPVRDLGRELTLQTPTEGGLSGRELTVQTPAPNDLSGRELTLQTPAPNDLSGRELTLEGTAAEGGLTGRELTMTPGEALSGRERTLGGAAATPTPATYGGRPATGLDMRPRTGGPGSSASFDDAWHLEGRKGPHTGQTWGDFELGGIVGEGGMGAVYRAKQKSLKRRVAIKVLASNLVGDARLLSRFKLEAETASRLVSPHIVQVYAIGQQEELHYYAMEFVDGTDLYDVIKTARDENRLPTPDEACNYILQAARGLAEAGRHGVVHRDIKPPNLMVTRDGHVKIADFGIVKVLGEHHLTLTGQAVGTPAYVSPEQGRGDRAVDHRSDIYSLGVVFYETITGQKPFTGTTPNALIYQHCYDEPVLPRNIVSGISDEIQAVILRCLQKKPENRYQTADDLVRDLEAIRTGSMLKSAIANYKLGTGADEAKREQMNWFQRHLLPLAVAAVLAVAGGGAGGYVWLTKTGEEKRQAELAALERRSQAESRIANLRGTLSKALDTIAPLPDGVDAMLDELANFAPDGARDADVVKWREKIDEVRVLQTRLAPVDGGRLDLVARRAARTDLEAYVGKVGAEDVAAARWGRRMADLDAEEARLRGAAAAFDAMQLKRGDRDRLAPLLVALAALVPAEDAQLAKWNARVANFDRELAVLRGRIAPLDTLATITEAQRVQFANALADLRGFLDENDHELRRWNDRLEGARGRVSTLREQITAVVGAAPDLIGRPRHDQIADKLVAYREAVGDDDPFVKDWLAAIAAGERSVAGCRSRLAAFAAQADDGLLPAGVLTPFERDLAQLGTLIHDGDAEVLAWDQLLRGSRRAFDELRADLRVLEPADPRPVTQAAQTDLAAKLTRLTGKGGIEPERADVYRQRLAAEARRIAALRAGLEPFDRPASITTAMREGLDRLAADVGDEDRDVQRWLAKQTRVDDLADRIGAIDRREPVPADLDRLFLAYEEAVGPDDARLVAWRGKVTRINEARAALAVLDRRASFDAAAVSAGLVTLAELVGASDAAYVRWRAKAEETGALKAALAPLTMTLVQDPAAQEAAHARLRRLHELVGPEDGDLRRAARRQHELDGPPRPSWAAEGGRDVHGLWADAELPGGRQRFRFVPSATVVVGSPDHEAWRDADELQVELTLPRAFWLADSELTQAVWRAVAGRDPSRFPGRDPAAQPVERASWDDAQGFIAALRTAMPELPARLPLEAEWELAARAGTEAPWQMPADLAADAEGVGKLAWTRDNARSGPRAVRTRLPNALGLYDVHGNVAEWVADAYGPWPTSATAVTAPAAGGELRVLRGGSWGDPWWRTRAANRIPVRGDLRSAYAGLRLALDAEWGGAEPDARDLLARLAQDGGQRAMSVRLGPWRLKLEREAGR